MKKKFFGANWKMNFSSHQAKNYFSTFNSLLQLNQFKNTDVVIFPPMQLLFFAQQLTHEQYCIGAQNFYPGQQGALTGEISSDMLSQDFIEYVIIGHSERRLLLKESDSLVAQKVQWAIANQLSVVFCCGEPLEIREQGKEKEFIKHQLMSALSDINPQFSHRIVVAYEPIWAIGTGKTALLQQIQEMHSFIQTELKSIGLNEQNIRIIYGGSVNAFNATEILSIPNVDGSLVGSASLKPMEFLSIISSLDK